MPFRRRRLVPCVLVVGIFVLAVGSGCTTESDRLFTRLSADHTGVDFANVLPERDSLLNPLDYFYVYNGGGVAVGDLNGDGRPDLYFAGNAVNNRLYLNQGNFQFEDATGTAGVAVENTWSTGIALVDINQDGRLDIYVCVAGPRKEGATHANRLYVNQGVGAHGVPTFEEQAADYGIADSGYSTQAAFFDYDRDGDLDLYVLNRAPVRTRTRLNRTGGDARRGSNQDRLYRNDGDGTFTEVSEAAGITQHGYGLGLAVSDINKDGWPDVYAANDLGTRDQLYMNQGDGTFADRSRRHLRHQSYSAMGVDVADVNNDSRSDIFVLDMLPQDPRRRRLVSTSGTDADRIWQYPRNTLQLNNGRGSSGFAPFSEIGQLAGVEATGWSWAPLLADYDNDGDRDLFISNGFGELITHLDFAQRRQRTQTLEGMNEPPAALYRAMEKLPKVHLANRFFENNGKGGTGTGGGGQFTEVTDTWALSRPGISNGAVFADLDRDGDLDLVTNNLNEAATLLENRADEHDRTHFLRVRLHGPDGNRNALGAKVRLRTDGTTQYHDHSPYRGYQSTVEGIVHFGLGADSTADSLAVVWPDGTSQVRIDVKADQVLDMHYAPPSASADPGPDTDSTTKHRSMLFREVAAHRGLAHRHSETQSRATNPLLPHQYSTNGPGIAVGDVDGNGLDDVFVGADRGRERVLFRQVDPGRFQKQTLSIKHRFTGASAYEDMGALLFDADGDGDQDLYVVSGSTVGPAGNPIGTYQDRLYLNGGTGTFTRAEEALPNMPTSGSVVTAADYDRDGDLDLFVGGRVRPGKYPLPPRSYLLRNDSEGGRVQFTDVTKDVAPDLAEVGLVSDALWTDYNGDGQVDLMIVGEWMPVTVFENDGGFKNGEGQFSDVTGKVGLQETSGWWNSLAGGDFDRDGETEYVAGNLGLNTRYEASHSEPVRVHAKDFDENGRFDPILSQFREGTSYPAHGRRELVNRFRMMQKRFPSHRAYAGASLKELFRENELEGAYVARAVRFATSYLDRGEGGTFEVRSLPCRAQMAPVFGMQVADYTGDGLLDLLMVGNWYAPDVETGRADASIGALLRGDGTGHFAPVSYPESGFLVAGDAKGLAEVATGEGTPLTVATQNNDSLRTFVSTQRRGRSVRLRPLDRSATLTFADGSTRKEELYYGSTYLSQSSRVLWVPPGVKSVAIHRTDDSSRIAPVDAVRGRNGKSK